MCFNIQNLRDFNISKEKSATFTNLDHKVFIETMVAKVISGLKVPLANLFVLFKRATTGHHSHLILQAEMPAEKPLLCLFLQLIYVMQIFIYLELRLIHKYW